MTKRLFCPSLKGAAKTEYLITIFAVKASGAAAETLCEFDTDFLCGMVYTLHDNLTIKD
jgi:hypothetical protein